MIQTAFVRLLSVSGEAKQRWTSKRFQRYQFTIICIINTRFLSKLARIVRKITSNFISLFHYPFRFFFWKAQLVTCLYRKLWWTFVTDCWSLISNPVDCHQSDVLPHVLVSHFFHVFDMAISIFLLVSFFMLPDESHSNHLGFCLSITFNLYRFGWTDWQCRVVSVHPISVSADEVLFGEIACWIFSGKTKKRLVWLR